MTVNLADHLEARAGIDLADAAYTLQNGRKQFAHRRTVVASSITEAVARLRSLDPKFTIHRKGHGPGAIHYLHVSGAGLPIPQHGP